MTVPKQQKMRVCKICLIFYELLAILYVIAIGRGILLVNTKGDKSKKQQLTVYLKSRLTELSLLELTYRNLQNL